MFKKVSNYVRNLRKLSSILNNITIRTDGESVLVETDLNIIIHSNSNILLNSPNGLLICNGKKFHMNPNIGLSIIDPINQKEIEKRVNQLVTERVNQLVLERDSFLGIKNVESCSHTTRAE